MRQKIFEEFYWNISLDIQILIAYQYCVKLIFNRL